MCHPVTHSDTYSEEEWIDGEAVSLVCLVLSTRSVSKVNVHHSGFGFGPA